MAETGFGAELWKHVQAVTIGPDGEIVAPVRAGGREGIVAGVDQMAESDRPLATGDPAAGPRARTR